MASPTGEQVVQLELVMDASILSDLDDGIRQSEAEREVLDDITEATEGPDLLELEMRKLREEETRIAARMVASRRIRERDELVQKLRVMRSELAIIETPVVAPTKNIPCNGGGKPSKTVKNPAFADYVPIPQENRLLRTVYSSEKKSTTTQYSRETVPTPQVKDNAYASIIVQNKQLNQDLAQPALAKNSDSLQLYKNSSSIVGDNLLIDKVNMIVLAICL